MQVQYLPLEAISPYAKNARHNDHAVDAVAASIKDFGFRQPVVVDRQMTIIAGHTRLKAASQLGLKEIPVLVADDLTDAQAKAYRLADNKTAEIATWDFDLLAEEIDDLSDEFDMEDYGFDLTDFDEEDPENERLRTDYAYNLDKVSRADCSGKWEMPTIGYTDRLPDSLIGFNYAKTTKDFSSAVHFFLDDYQFERVWNDMGAYTVLLGKFACVLSPDFSLYLDMPLPVKIWNVYRSRAVGHFWASQGIGVIPTLSWGESDTFKFCFEGVAKESVVAVSTVGVMRDKSARAIWNAGMAEAIKQLKPKRVLLYGGSTKFDFGTVEVVEYPAFTEVRYGRTGSE